MLWGWTAPVETGTPGASMGSPGQSRRATPHLQRAPSRMSVPHRRHVGSASNRSALFRSRRSHPSGPSGTSSGRSCFRCAPWRASPGLRVRARPPKRTHPLRLTNERSPPTRRLEGFAFSLTKARDRRARRSRRRLLGRSAAISRSLFGPKLVSELPYFRAIRSGIGLFA